MLETLLDRFRHGDRLALARLLSLAARGEHLDKIADALQPTKATRVVALTGSAGAGKSTLAGKLIEVVRRQGHSVAVLACDPQSPVSGGALLGDRFRMPSLPHDTGVFIRSLATASGTGATAAHLGLMIRILEAFGFDVVLVETVGAGQGDTAIRELADVVVLLLQPETGDDLQWEKAGLLEVADVVAIHKADLPGAERMGSQVRAVLGLSSTHEVPIIRVSAKTGEGVEHLSATLGTLPLRRESTAKSKRALMALAQELAASRFAQADARRDPELARLLEEWRKGSLRTSEAASALLALLAGQGENA